MSLPHVNAVIVGAGAGGGIVAKELAQAGLSVILLERGQWPRYDISNDDELFSQRTPLKRSLTILAGTAVAALLLTGSCRPPPSRNSNREQSHVALCRRLSCYRTRRRAIWIWRDCRQCRGDRQDFVFHFSGAVSSLGRGRPDQTLRLL